MSKRSHAKTYKQRKISVSMILTIRGIYDTTPLSCITKANHSHPVQWIKCLYPLDCLSVRGKQHHNQEPRPRPSNEMKILQTSSSGNDWQRKIILEENGPSSPQKLSYDQARQEGGTSILRHEVGRSQRQDDVQRLGVSGRRR